MEHKTAMICIALLILAGTASAFIAPDTWGQGYKMYNASGWGKYWDLMGGAGGIRNGSVTNLSYVQLNISDYAPQRVNGTIWINRTDGNLTYFWNGNNYSINRSAVVMV